LRFKGTLIPIPNGVTLQIVEDGIIKLNGYNITGGTITLDDDAQLIPVLPQTVHFTLMSNEVLFENYKIALTT